METGNKDWGMLVNSIEIASARLLESVLRSNQLAASASPEINCLFEEWLSCLEGEILSSLSAGIPIQVANEAERIGLSPYAYLSLITALQRRGKLRVTELKMEGGNEGTGELCDCFADKQNK